MGEGPIISSRRTVIWTEMQIIHLATQVNALYALLLRVNAVNAATVLPTTPVLCSP